jgi:hypothetical protein
LTATQHVLNIRKPFWLRFPEKNGAVDVPPGLITGLNPHLEIVARGADREDRAAARAVTTSPHQSPVKDDATLLTAVAIFHIP